MQDNELKSEAQFQRLLASFSDSPSNPRTPRAPSDRGRYPEEAGDDEPQRESTTSDEEELDESVQFSYNESVVPMKPVTPAQSINGDDPSMLESPLGVAMDVDMVRVVLRSSILVIVTHIISLALVSHVFPHHIIVAVHTPSYHKCRAE